MIIQQCAECGKDYLAEKKYLNRGQGKFCNRDCAVKFNSRQKIINHEPNTKCYECKIPLYRKPSLLEKFKNFFCSVEHQRKSFDVQRGPKPKRKIVYCETCNKILLSSHSRFCSSKCKSEFNSVGYINRWKVGLESGLSGKNGQISATLRKYLIQEANYKCSQCAWGETNVTTGKIPLTIDHINGKWWENHSDNLRVLCPNCHSLTSTYGALNKGNGRPKRRK